QQVCGRLVLPEAALWQGSGLVVFRRLCCAGRDLRCLSAGWRPDGSHGPCYCDEACAHTLDCCHDYAWACPGERPVSQWSVWSGCAEPCRTTYRVRRRRVLREPRNGGEPCPALEERAGCVHYWSRQGAECKQALSESAANKLSWKWGRTPDLHAGYCVEFQLVAIMPGCMHSHRSHTRWMRYLREGHTVCVECQHPALDSRSLHCYGDGSGSQENELLHWQAVGNPQCRGTWKRIRQLDTCSCPSVHSFLFI
uniref:Somatomedin-B and thrombospondin type-1 domain-containing protein-like n=1 Tax=Nothoprocta perdicaria TaxID=30464 RepID=A0A8C6ZE83_NOTPE